MISWLEEEDDDDEEEEEEEEDIREEEEGGGQQGGGRVHWSVVQCSAAHLRYGPMPISPCSAALRVAASSPGSAGTRRGAGGTE